MPIRILDRFVSTFPPSRLVRPPVTAAEAGGGVSALPLALILLTLSIGSLSCRGPEPERFTFADLVAEASFAESLAEPAEIILGTAGGRRWLGGGWSTRDEQDGHGSFVWAVGEASRLSLTVLEPTDQTIEIELRPFHYDGAATQSMIVELGGEEIWRGELPPGVGVLSFELPAEHQVAGENELLLKWAWHRSPSEVLGVADRRSLAAAVYRMTFPGRADAGEGPRAEGERLWLPVGNRLDFYFDLPAASLLEIPEVGLRGGAEARLEIRKGEERSTHKVESGRVHLPAGPTLLRFMAKLGKADGGADVGNVALRQGGVLLHSPEILSPVAGVEPRGGLDPLADPGTPDAAMGEAGSETGDGPSIILYSIDTLRADALGIYGGPVPTPILEEFAADALVFEQATAQSSWTKASMASVLTGLKPFAHGALSRRHILNPERLTIQELLSAAGYQTAAFSTNPNLTPDFGFDQGFDHFEALDEATTAAGVVDAVEAWLSTERDPHRPLFLWVHTLDPHSPYAPPPEARERWAADVPAEVAAESRRLLDDMRALRRPRDEGLLGNLRRLYEAEAAYSDQIFGRFLDLIESHGLGEAALLLLSDHGEEFYEHGNLEHGRALYQESVHIPMMLRVPGLAAARVSTRVQHIDVLPTLLEIAGLPSLPGLEGRSLMATRRPDHEPDLILHLHLDGAERAAIVRFPLKLISERQLDGRLGRFRLYDLAQDPGESKTLTMSRPLDRGVLAQALRRALAGRSAAEEIELDSEMRRRLEALGYL